MSPSEKKLTVATLAVAIIGGGAWLAKKEFLSNGFLNNRGSGTVAESKAREASAREAIRVYQTENKKKPASPVAQDKQGPAASSGGGTNATSPAARVTTTEQRYLEALGWISKKALKSQNDTADFKAAWADSSFLDSLGRGLQVHEMSSEASMPVSMLATSLLVTALNNPATFSAAEGVVLKHLKEVRIENLRTGGSSPDTTMKVAENQGELLFHWAAQAQNADAKLRALERTSPSTVRRAILANVDREHRNNLSMSALELRKDR